MLALPLTKPSGGGSFGTLSGLPGDNAALAAALAAKLDKAGGTMTGALVNSANGAASTPALQLTGTPFTGGSATTTKPLALLETAGATSNNWSTSGTMLGVNAPSGFAGDLCRVQLNGVDRFRVTSAGNATVAGTLTVGAGTFQDYGGGQIGLGNHYFSANGIFANTCLRVSTGGLGSGFSASLYPNGAASEILEQRNGTAAQKFRVFGSETGSKYAQLEHDGTNAKLSSSSGDLHISSLPTSNPGPGILWNNAGTPAIGT